MASLHSRNVNFVDCSVVISLGIPSPDKIVRRRSLQLANRQVEATVILRVIVSVSLLYETKAKLFSHWDQNVRVCFVSCNSEPLALRILNGVADPTLKNKT